MNDCFHISQNLAVYLLVLIEVEAARLAKSCSQFRVYPPSSSPGHLSRSALGARGFRPLLDSGILSLSLLGSSDLITPGLTGSGDRFSPSYGPFCNSYKLLLGKLHSAL